MRDIAAEIDPTLRVQRALPLSQVARGNVIAYDATFRALVVAGLMALLLANAGTYAVIAFTVARRTREIGIRVALGAGRRQVLSAVLSRTTGYVALGVLACSVIGSCLALGFAEGGKRPRVLALGALMAAYLCGMMSVCLLAGVGPIRRALKVDPVQALASEG